jgi:DNA-binding NarL/FixJ family response regulator
VVAVVVCHAEKAVVDAIAERLSIESDLSPVFPTVGLLGLSEIVSAIQPDVLVLAESAAGRASGGAMVDTVAGIRRRGQRPAILIVTPSSKLAVAVDAVAAGADGWVAEEAPVEELVHAIRGIYEGRVWLSRNQLQAFLNRTTGHDDSVSRLRARFERLTARELATLRLLLEGKDGGAIAHDLGIKRSTARVHIGHVLSKLEVHSTLEAVALARRFGMVARSTVSEDAGFLE